MDDGIDLSVPPPHGDIAWFRSSGLLWFINRHLFHDLGFALGVDEDDGTFFIYGDGGERWEFGDDPDGNPINDAMAAIFDEHGFGVMLELKPAPEERDDG